MSNMLQTIKRVLERCKVSAEEFASQAELKNALLDAFIALIKFWVEASKLMREKNSGICVLPLPDMFSLTMSGD